MFSSFRFEAKQSEKTFISFRLEAKRKNRKRNEAKRKKFWTRNKAKIRFIDFALVGSEKFEAKRSEMKQKKNLFFSRERAKWISFRFVSLWSEKIFEAKPAHPSWERWTPLTPPPPNCLSCGHDYWPWPDAWMKRPSLLRPQWHFDPIRTSTVTFCPCYNVNLVHLV